MVVREGFEPSKAEPADLQSAPFGRSGTSPHSFEWCRLSDSNQPPADYKSAALPDELKRQHKHYINFPLICQVIFKYLKNSLSFNYSIFILFRFFSNTFLLLQKPFLFAFTSLLYYFFKILFKLTITFHFRNFIYKFILCYKFKEIIHYIYIIIFIFCRKA